MRMNRKIPLWAKPITWMWDWQRRVLWYLTQVSADHVVVTAVKGGAVLNDCVISEVTYSSVNASNKKAFAFITLDKNQMGFCHFVTVKGHAAAIHTAVKSAYHAAQVVARRDKTEVWVRYFVESIVGQDLCKSGVRRRDTHVFSIGSWLYSYIRGRYLRPVHVFWQHFWYILFIPCVIFNGSTPKGSLRTHIVEMGSLR